MFKSYSNPNRLPSMHFGYGNGVPLPGKLISSVPYQERKVCSDSKPKRLSERPQRGTVKGDQSLSCILSQGDGAPGLLEVIIDFDWVASSTYSIWKGDSGSWEWDISLQIYVLVARQNNKWLPRGASLPKIKLSVKLIKIDCEYEFQTEEYSKELCQECCNLAYKGNNWHIFKKSSVFKVFFCFWEIICIKFFPL